MWQRKFRELASEDFTVVGLALDVEGIAPAKTYYEKYGVEFPALVDPNYATKFGAVPKTFFIDEHGVVGDVRNWESHLSQLGPPQEVAAATKAQFSPVDSRLGGERIARLVAQHAERPADLKTATELASRYIALELYDEARAVSTRAVDRYDAKQTARAGGSEAQLLAQTYLQLTRSCQGDKEKQIQYASIAYFLHPTIGFGKQITRIMDPSKFDNTRSGRLDDTFRQSNYLRLKKLRTQWLATD